VQGSLTDGEGISAVDLLVSTGLDQLLYNLKLFFPFYKTTYLNEEVNRTDPSPSIRLPWNVYTLATDGENSTDRGAVNAKSVLKKLG
jgi:hypothetical protein